nr:MAG TPA: hypothetical protein [Caudoviricetes sp.]
MNIYEHIKIRKVLQDIWFNRHSIVLLINI